MGLDSDIYVGFTPPRMSNTTLENCVGCRPYGTQHLWSLPIYKGHEDLPTTYKQKHPLGFHSGTWKLCHPKWESLTLEFIIVKVKISDLGRIERIGKSPCCNFS